MKLFIKKWNNIVWKLGNKKNHASIFILQLFGVFLFFEKIKEPLHYTTHLQLFGVKYPFWKFTLRKVNDREKKTLERK